MDRYTVYFNLRQYGQINKLFLLLYSKNIVKKAL
jgi:hypothetical protein